VKDALGNTLEAGHLVLWNNMIAKVVSVESGGLSVVSKDRKGVTLPQLTLELKIQVQPGQPIPVIRVVDPASESLIESVMGAS
jgi:hypothetical protein